VTFECKVVPRTSTSLGKTQLLPPSFAYNHPRVSHVVESYWLQGSGLVVVTATSLMYIELKRNNNTAAGATATERWNYGRVAALCRDNNKHIRQRKEPYARCVYCCLDRSQATV
jgi:hypothetical protein